MAGPIIQEKLESFTTSKTDRHLLHQKVCQRISGMKINKGVFVVFKTKGPFTNNVYKRRG